MISTWAFTKTKSSRYTNEFMYSFIHSFVRSFVRSFTCSFILVFIHSFIHSFIRLFIFHSSIHISMHSFIHPSIHPSIHSLSFIHWFIHAFIHSFILCHVMWAHFPINYHFSSLGACHFKTSKKWKKQERRKNRTKISFTLWTDCVYTKKFVCYLIRVKSWRGSPLYSIALPYNVTATDD